MAHVFSVICSSAKYVGNPSTTEFSWSTANVSLTICILMDTSFWFDTINLG